MLLALALLLWMDGEAQGSQPQPRSRAYRPTPESLTEPIRELDCRLADRQRRWSPLRLRYAGRRGYRTASGGVRSTRPRIEIIHDPANLLQGLPLWQADDDTILFGSERGRSIVFWSVSPPPAFSTVVLVPRADGMERARGDPSWAGFCRVIETHQRPLSDEEARREERR